MTERIVTNFDLRTNEPIDIRYEIDSLNKQVDIAVRYLGLIFITKDTKRIYIYIDNINTPTLLSEFLERDNLNGAKVTDYSKLHDTLKKYQKIGKIFTIYPLNVSFIFDGTKWKYFSGDYEVETVEVFNSIPKDLIGDKVKVHVTKPTPKTYITLADGKLSDEIIALGDDISGVINGRFYSKNGNLYYCIDGVLFNVGSRESILKQFNIKNGINKLTHNLNSKNLSVSLIIPKNNTISQVTHYESIDNNSINFESYCDISNVTVIIKTI